MAKEVKSVQVGGTKKLVMDVAVSYTHLTLPTNSLV